MKGRSNIHRESLNPSKGGSSLAFKNMFHMYELADIIRMVTSLKAMYTECIGASVQSAYSMAAFTSHTLLSLILCNKTNTLHPV